MITTLETKSCVRIEPHTQAIAEAILEGLNSPKSLSTFIKLKYMYEDPALAREIADPVIDPKWYDNWKDFDNDYKAVKLLSQARFLPTGIDREAVAYEKFKASEDACKLTNERFSNLWKDPLKTTDSDIISVLHMASYRISQVLGNMPPISDVHFSFGPGSTTSCKGSRTASYYKIKSELDMTLNCLPLLPLVKRCDAWMKVHGRTPRFNVVTGSKLIFVEKNAKTMRSICVEPTINSWLQKGFGAAIRQKLNRIGLLKPEAQELHRNAAKAASSTDELATVDLSAASDSIAYNFVLDMLGSTDWLLCLESTRSPGYTYKGEVFTFEKFSSMGNGYTFELETLLFYALAWAVCKSENVSDEGLSVYGDDIIIPARCVSLLKRVLSFCGFNLNMDKSFSDSYFRESCGGHFFNGRDVTPLYLKEEIQDGYQAIIISNKIRLIAGQNLYGYACDNRFKPGWDTAVRCVRQKLRHVPRGPKGFGDGHVFANWDEARPDTVICYGQLGFKYRTFQRQHNNRVETQGLCIYADLLYNAGSDEDSNSFEADFNKSGRESHSRVYRVNLRRGNEVRKLTLCQTIQWPDMGPWL